MGKRRTPAELIAASEEKTSALKRRHAIEQAKDSEELTYLVGRFETLEAQVRKAETLCGAGSQGFAFRREQKLLWIKEIDAHEKLCTALMDGGEALVEDFRSTIADLAERLAAGDDCSDAIEAAESAIGETDSEELKALFSDYDFARHTRQAASELSKG